MDLLFAIEQKSFYFCAKPVVPVSTFNYSNVAWQKLKIREIGELMANLNLLCLGKQIGISEKG